MEEEIKTFMRFLAWACKENLSSILLLVIFVTLIDMIAIAVFDYYDKK